MVYLVFKRARYDFLMSQMPEYEQAVAEGTGNAFFDIVYARYARRFPIEMSLDEDPPKEVLDAVDDNAPILESDLICIENLSDEEIVAAQKKIEERRALIKKRKRQISTWFTYRYMKRHSVDPRAKDPSNPFTSMLFSITGKSMKDKPRQKSAVHCWSKVPETMKAINDEVYKVCVREGTSRNHSVAIWNRVAREQFSRLDEAEKKKWEEKAKKDHQEELAAWSALHEGNISTDPVDRQRCIEGLVRLGQSVIEAMSAATGWNLALYAGGPEPAAGGRLTIVSLYAGTNNCEDPLNFGQDERPALVEHFFPIFTRFLRKSFTPEECRRRILPQPVSGLDPLSDVDLEVRGGNLDHALISPPPPVEALSSAPSSASLCAPSGVEQAAPPAPTPAPGNPTSANVSLFHARPVPPPHQPSPVVSTPVSPVASPCARPVPPPHRAASPVVSPPVSPLASPLRSPTRRALSISPLSSPLGPAAGPVQTPPLPINSELHDEQAPVLQRAGAGSEAPQQRASIDTNNASPPLPPLPIGRDVAPLPVEKEATPLPVEKEAEPLSIEGAAPLPVEKNAAPLPIEGAAPLPVEKEAAPLPVEKEAAPLPVEKEAAPLPVEKEAAPLPVEKEAAPLPVAGGAPLPVKKDAAPLPIEGVAPLPVEEEPAPQPVEEEPAPLPVEKDAAPTEQETSTSPPIVIDNDSDDIEQHHRTSGRKRSTTERASAAAAAPQAKRRRTAAGTHSSKARSVDAGASRPSSGAATHSTLESLKASHPWLNTVLEMFSKTDLGPDFTKLVDAWLAFELKFNCNPNGTLPATGRPPAVGDWIARARKPTFNSDAFISDSRVYGDAHIAWWGHLQPEWRVVDDGVYADVGAGEGWDCLLKPGINGIVSVVASLYFWGKAVKKAGRKAKRWDVHVADTTCVIEHITSSL